MKIFQKCENRVFSGLESLPGQFPAACGARNRAPKVRKHNSLGRSEAQAQEYRHNGIRANGLAHRAGRSLYAGLTVLDFVLRKNLGRRPRLVCSRAVGLPECPSACCLQRGWFIEEPGFGNC